MRVKRNAVFGARFKGLSLYFLYQKGNQIRIKAGLDTDLIRIQTGTPLSRYPPYVCSKSQEPKKGISVKKLGRNPPLPDPPPRDPLPPQVLMFGASFPFNIQEKGLGHREFRKGGRVLGAPKLFMQNCFACLFCT